MQKTCNISSKIREIRFRNNLSQERFGMKIGVTGKCISAYETGKCNPPLKILEAISKTYDAAILHLKASKKEELEEKLKSIKDSLLEIEEILERSLPL
jgi:transcriptional regulator with XRE-family HTH domain